MKKSIVLICLLFVLSSMSIPTVIGSVYGLQVTFVTNPTTASPGVNGYLEVNLESVGTGTVSDVDISVSNWDSSIIIPKGNWKVSIGDIDGGDSVSVLYEFIISDSAVPGLYQLIFEISSSVESIRQTAMIQVEDTTVLDIVSVTPRSINIGEMTTLIFNVTNNGGSTAGNIVFTWEDASDLILPVGADNRITVSSIAAENYVEIPIDIMASPSINPGVYPLTITMQFYDRTGTLQTITSNVGLQIGGGTDFEIVLQSTTGSATFAITNTGANVASSVIVSIPRQTNFISSGSSSTSLGNLDAGDYTLATFQITSTSQNTGFNFTQRSNSNRSMRSFPSDFNPEDIPSDFDPGEMGGFMNRGAGGTGTNLVIEISYTDLFGIRQTVQKEVEYSAGSSATNLGDATSRFGTQSGSRISGGQQSESDTGTTYIIVGVIGIIIIVALLQIGKKRNIPYLSKKLKGKNNENK